MTLEAVVQRALDSRGQSAEPIYAAVVEALRDHGARGTLVDVGCGHGRLCDRTRGIHTDYVGIDVVRHDGFPQDATFACCDLECEPVPLPAGCADIVAAVETIEHLENPRRLFREMARVLRPGGYLVVSTPNQISALSILSLVVKGQFVAFQDASYPAHRVALLPVDLERLAIESGLEPREVRYTCHGRIPLTRRHYPPVVSHLFPRRLSDNVLLLAAKPV